GSRDRAGGSAVGACVPAIVGRPLAAVTRAPCPANPQPVGVVVVVVDAVSEDPLHIVGCDVEVVGVAGTVKADLEDDVVSEGDPRGRIGPHLVIERGTPRTGSGGSHRTRVGRQG